jgi:hypothetical protein
MPPPSPTVRYTKRLADKILVAFHHACDQGDVQVASELLGVLDFMATRKPPLPTSEVRRPDRGLVGAHERLWQLRNPENGGGTGVRLRKGELSPGWLTLLIIPVKDYENNMKTRDSSQWAVEIGC